MEDAKYLGAYLRSKGQPEANIHTILYIAQLVSLADDDAQPLFFNRIEVWGRGPVVPDVDKSQYLSEPLQDTNIEEFLWSISETLKKDSSIMKLLHEPLPLWKVYTGLEEGGSVSIECLRTKLEEPDSVESQLDRRVQAHLGEREKKLQQALSDTDLSEFERASKLVIHPF